MFYLANEKEKEDTSTSIYFVLSQTKINIVYIFGVLNTSAQIIKLLV